MSDFEVIIFTDLDGSLLNHDNFEFDSIKPFIVKCIENNIQIIPNTSKTKCEVEYFCNQLGINLPFIVENGSAIYNSDLLFSNCEMKNKTLILSRTSEEILEVFQNKIPLSFRRKCLFLSDMDTGQQTKVLGLKEENISFALNRLFSIPFVFDGSLEIKNEFKMLFNELDIKIHEGGRILNICDNCSKGDAMKIILEKLTNNTKKKYHSIVVGDSSNDISMLKLSNQPCVVPLPNKDHMKNLKIKNIIIAKDFAPQGWREVVLKSLQKINFKFKEDNYG